MKVYDLETHFFTESYVSYLPGPQHLQITGYTVEVVFIYMIHLIGISTYE